MVTCGSVDWFELNHRVLRHDRSHCGETLFIGEDWGIWRSPRVATLDDHCLADARVVRYLLPVYLVGDADRERGLARLRLYYAEGRLSVEELIDRVELLAGARTTREMRLALRDLPYGRVESELVPRLVALRSSPVGEAVARRIARIALATMMLTLWLSVSVVLLGALAVWQLAEGPSAEAATILMLVWVAVTWLSLRIWRARARRV